MPNETIIAKETEKNNSKHRYIALLRSPLHAIQSMS